MTRALLVLRPEPGNRETVTRIEALGLRALSLPLFAVVPVAWLPPDPRDFDAVLFTSANAVRHGGGGLAHLRGLPVVAVGGATATAARAAGFDVALTGGSVAAAAVSEAGANGLTRLLRLGGRDRIEISGIADVTVYASEPVDVAPKSLRLAVGTVALLHSPRAARVFAAAIDRAAIARATVRIAALSAAVAAAAGPGWDAIGIASLPDDAALVACAAARAIDPPRADGDKQR